MSNDNRANGGLKLGLAARALRHRNFRLFFIGQSVSLIGTWMQQVAMSWLIYRLTGSALYLGWVGFLGQIPAFFIAPVAGVFADRWNRHRIVIATQALSMIQAFILAALVLTHNIAVWHILVLAAFGGMVSGFDIPARQAFLVQMVEEKHDLANAIALNSSMFNGARLIGPAIAGVIIGIVGEGICFLLNGLSYVAILISLLLMRVPSTKPPTSTQVNALRNLIDGFRYSFRAGPIRAVLTLVAVASLFGTPYSVLMPVIATQVLHGNAKTLGFLMAATGLGATTGALFLAIRPTVRGLGRIIVVGASIFGGALVLFAFSHALWLSMLLLLFTGFGMMVLLGSCNTILQTIVDEDKRGRVMSFYTVAFIGTAPIGSLMSGALANRIGAPITIAAGGAICIIAASIFALYLPNLRQLLRPIYARLGIPELEVASTLKSVDEPSVPEVQ